MNGGGASWCVATTKPAAEELAERSIRGAGYRVYLPRYRKILRGTRIGERGQRIRTRGAGKIVLRPLFTGYLFVELWPEQEWGAIVRATGVSGVIGSRSSGATVPGLLSAEIIEMIREVERSGEFDEARPSGRRTDIAPGAHVGVPELSGIIAQLVSLDDRGRARVLLQMLGAERETTVDARGLVAIAENG